jgi:hypothetical protein
VPPPVEEAPPDSTEATSPSASEAAVSSTGTPRPSGTDGAATARPTAATFIDPKPSNVNVRGKVVPTGALGAPFAFPLLDAPFRAFVAYLTATAGGLALFVWLVRRRAADPEPAPVPVPYAAVAPADFPAARDETRVTPLPPMRELIPPVNPNLLSDADERVGPLPGEAGVPRWLRPSLRQARQSHDSRRLRGWED